MPRFSKKRAPFKISMSLTLSSSDMPLNVAIYLILPALARCTCAGPVLWADGHLEGGVGTCGSDPAKSRPRSNALLREGRRPGWDPSASLGSSSRSRVARLLAQGRWPINRVVLAPHAEPDGAQASRPVGERARVVPVGPCRRGGHP